MNKEVSMNGIRNGKIAFAKVEATLQVLFSICKARIFSGAISLTFSTETKLSLLSRVAESFMSESFNEPVTVVFVTLALLVFGLSSKLTMSEIGTLFVL